MKKLIVVALVCGGFGAAGQTAVGYNGTINGKVTISYPDHTVTAMVRPADTRSIVDPGKSYSWYSSNQIRTTTGGYSGKLLDGPYTDFYLNKNIREKGAYKNGLKAGEWRAWNESGALLTRESWRAGEKNGAFYKYDAKGTLLETGNFRANRLHGKQVSYTGGTPVITYFKDGRPYQPKHRVARFFQKLNPFGKKKDVKK